jgi:hypothetical protein
VTIKDARSKRAASIRKQGASSPSLAARRAAWIALHAAVALLALPSGPLQGDRIASGS